MSGNLRQALPPANPEAEQSLLGAILVRPEILGPVAEILKPADFYYQDHGRIFQAMLDLKGRGEPVDLVTVSALLKERGQLDRIGGPDMAGVMFLATLSEHVGHAVNGEAYARIVRKSSLQRQFQYLLKRLFHEGQKPGINLEELLTHADSELLELIESVSGNGLNGSGAASFKGVGELILETTNFLNLDLPPKRVILDPWITESAIIMGCGWRGVGKTMFAIGALDAITRGVDFGPWKTVTPVNCLYLDGEMPPQDTAERLKSLTKAGRKKELFIYSDAYAHSLGFQGANLLNEEWRQAMKDILVQKEIKLWVLDNIASLAPGIDENSKQEWDPINQWLLKLRSVGISTFFLHHPGKGGSQRGTSGREDNIDISILLEKPKNYVPTDGARFIVKFEKARIRNKDLYLTAETEFSLEVEENDSYVWTFAPLKKQNKVEVIKMLDAAIPANDIAKELGVTKGRVSQIKNEAIKEGLITGEGKLTQSGFLYLQKN